MSDGYSTKRRFVRLENELPVAYRTTEGFVTDWVTNISEGGLFINARHALPVGTTVTLIIQLPDSPSPFELKGKIVRASELCDSPAGPPGMGIEFIELEQDKRDRIEQFVEKLIAKLPPEPKKPRQVK